MTPVYYGSVVAGKIRWANKRQVANAVTALDGHEIEVTIKKKRSQRSVEQLRFWWAVPVRLLAEHTGYSDADMHYALLGACFGYKPGPLGGAVPNVPSSSELSVEEFSRLIEWVLTWAPAELGVNIPAPNEVSLD